MFRRYPRTPFEWFRNSQGAGGCRKPEGQLHLLSSLDQVLPLRKGGPASLLDRTTQEITASLNEPEKNRLQEFNNFYHNTPNRAIGENSALFFKKKQKQKFHPKEKQVAFLTGRRAARPQRLRSPRAHATRGTKVWAARPPEQGRGRGRPTNRGLRTPRPAPGPAPGFAAPLRHGGHPGGRSQSRRTGAE